MTYISYLAALSRIAFAYTVVLRKTSNLFTILVARYASKLSNKWHLISSPNYRMDSLARSQRKAGICAEEPCPASAWFKISTNSMPVKVCKHCKQKLFVSASIYHQTLSEQLALQAHAASGTSSQPQVLTRSFGSVGSRFL